MDRVLVLYYSQSGEVADIASLFATELSRTGAEVMIERLNPETPHPYPWRSIRRFFDAMPESVLGLPPPIRLAGYDPTSRFRLVVLAYPVWFLAPALPVQAFFRLPHAEVLRGTETVTITVSRAMWQRASERIKGLLATVGAVHCDNVVVTHQGSPLLTLVSTPRALVRTEGLPPWSFPQGRRRRFGTGSAPRTGCGHGAAAPERPIFRRVVAKWRTSDFDHALASRSRTVGVILFLRLGGRNSCSGKDPSNFAGTGGLCVHRFSALAYFDWAPTSNRRFGTRVVRHAGAPRRLRQNTVNADRN
jgi:hypothetical protein